VTSASQLEQIARTRLDSALAEAKRGADPRRVHEGDGYTRPVGQSREAIRERAAQDYERWRFADDTDAVPYSLVLIVETVRGGQACVDAEAFDLGSGSGSSVCISQPVKKSFGRWKPHGAATVLGAAESLTAVLQESALRYDLEPLPYEERVRLSDILEGNGTPHLRDGIIVYVAPEFKAGAEGIAGWPDGTTVSARGVSA
jgi:hypothetical protein